MKAIELDQFIESSTYNRKLIEELIDPQKLKEYCKNMDELDTKALWKRIEANYPFPQRRADCKLKQIAATVLSASHKIWLYCSPQKKIECNNAPI